MINLQFLNKSLLIKPKRLSYLSAWIGHIPFAFWLIEELRPGLVIELGTHSGISYFVMCQAVQFNSLDTKCYAVDTWLGDEHSGLYPEAIFQDVYSYNKEQYASFSNLMRMPFDDALQYFSDGSIDLLHIDGMHSYDAVKHDFDNWLPKVSPRGVIIMHDISVRELGFGVWRLWEELKQRYQSFEFSHSSGLGVLFVGAESERILKVILSAGQNEVLVRNLFASLADPIEKEIARDEAFLYLDDGSGFSEENTLRKIYGPVNFYFHFENKFNIPVNVVNIRYDPSYNCCVVKDLNINSNIGEVAYTTNGCKLGDSILFPTNDPQVLIKDTADITWIYVDAQIYGVGSDVFMENMEKCVNELNKSRNSVFRRMTKPFRKICDFFRRK